jgi:hypothetical protein
LNFSKIYYHKYSFRCDSRTRDPHVLSSQFPECDGESRCHHSKQQLASLIIIVAATPGIVSSQPTQITRTNVFCCSEHLRFLRHASLNNNKNMGIPKQTSLHVPKQTN